MRPANLPLDITYYNRAAINFTFLLVFALSLVVCFDQAIFAGASLQIKQSLSIDSFQFGGLQSLAFLGVLLGKCPL